LGPAESGALRGISFDPVVTPAPDLSGGGASGLVSSSTSAPGRGLGGSGGGMGRVADGASGISSGFCCAAKTPASNNASPRISTVLIFLAIPDSPIFDFLRRFFLVERFLLIQMPNRAALVHLTVTGSYRID
jgi:hypothetical protein